jgi:hypothetical protein
MWGYTAGFNHVTVPDRVFQSYVYSIEARKTSKVI